MKRALRSTASVSDAKSKPQQKSSKSTIENSRPLRRRKDGFPKENKENVTTATKKTKKNVHKNVVQPLQEKNSVAPEPKNDKTTPSSASARTAEPDTSTKIDVPTNTASKPRNRRPLVGNENRTEEKIATELNAKTIADQPPSVPEKSIESVSIRKRKPSKTIQQVSVAQETLATDCPTKRTRQHNDEIKVVETSTTTKPVVPFSTKTRSTAKRSEESNVTSLRSETRSRTNRQATKTQTKKPVATKSDEKNKKTKTSQNRNVKEEQNREKKSVSKSKTNSDSKSSVPPDTDSVQFITIRKNRKELGKPAAVPSDNKSQSTESIVSNVTKRRQRANSQTVAKNESKSIDAVSDIPKRKRSQSVYRDAHETKMDTKSKTNVAVSPPKRRRITKKDEPKNVDAVTAKPQQPELSVNRSTGSDTSDQSNASVVPIYKRMGYTNNNTEERDFEFMSNSQDSTLNGDEETQKVLAKMIKQKRVCVAKRKGNGKKGGVTKAKTNIKSKQIAKLSSDLKEIHSNLKELKERNVRTKSEPAPNVTKRRAIPKPPMNSSRIENHAMCSENIGVVDLVDEEIASAKDSPRNSDQFESVRSDRQHLLSDIANDMQFEVDHSDFEDHESIAKPSKNDMSKPSKPSHKLNATSTKTPPIQVTTTYTGPRKQSTPIHQSTPVQTVDAGKRSPWRLISDSVRFPINFFGRYSECEKSPIKSGDVTKVAAEAKSPAKRPQPSLAKKSIPDKFPETEKPKTLENDIRTGFGFLDENDEDEAECYEPRSSLPAPNHSIVPSYVNATRRKPAPLATSTMRSTKVSKTAATPPSKAFKMPQGIFNRIRETVQSIKNSTLASESQQKSESKSKTQTKITTLFGDASKPSSSKGTKAAMKTSQYDGARLKESSNIEVTNPHADTDAFSLFETTSFTDDKPHRSYSRVTKREPKRQYEYKSFLTDDRSECGDSVVQKRTKRTKPKDDKHHEELRQFEEQMNSDFMDVDRFEMIMEKSVSSSNLI